MAEAEAEAEGAAAVMAEAVVAAADTAAAVAATAATVTDRATAPLEDQAHRPALARGELVVEVMGWHRARVKLDLAAGQ